jgi:predicted nucleotidyltransferase
MIEIEPRHVEIIRRILKAHLPEYEVWAFGSRVHGERLKRFSDIDLAVIADKPLEVLRLAGVREAFSESDIPFKVDIIDWASTDESFRRIIRQAHEVIQRSEKG